MSVKNRLRSIINLKTDQPPGFYKEDIHRARPQLEFFCFGLNSWFLLIKSSINYTPDLSNFLFSLSSREWILISLERNFFSNTPEQLNNLLMKSFLAHLQQGCKKIPRS